MTLTLCLSYAEARMLNWPMQAEGKPMMYTIDTVNTYRKTATVVGGLFIFAIVMLFVGEAIYKPILDSQNYLEKVYPNRVAVMMGVLIEFTVVPAVVLLSVLLFPVLKRHNEALALGYVSLRVLDVAILSIAYVNTLSIINLSQNYLNSDGADVAYFEYAGESIRAVNSWAGTTGLLYLVVFAFGSLILYAVLYRSRLVPRFISVFGFGAGLLLLFGSVLAHVDVFTDISGTGVEVIFAAPIALAEVMLSFWLIFKGFDLTTVDNSSNS